MRADANPNNGRQDARALAYASLSLTLGVQMLADVRRHLGAATPGGATEELLSESAALEACLEALLKRLMRARDMAEGQSE